MRKQYHLIIQEQGRHVRVAVTESNDFLIVDVGEWCKDNDCVNIRIKEQKIYLKNKYNIPANRKIQYY